MTTQTKSFDGPLNIKTRKDGLVNLYCGSHDIALCLKPINGEYIKKVCNSYEALVEGAKDALEYLRQVCPEDKEHWGSLEEALKQTEE